MVKMNTKSERNNKNVAKLLNRYKRDIIESKCKKHKHDNDSKNQHLDHDHHKEH